MTHAAPRAEAPNGIQRLQALRRASIEAVAAFNNWARDGVRRQSRKGPRRYGELAVKAQ